MNASNQTRNKPTHGQHGRRGRLSSSWCSLLTGSAAALFALSCYVPPVQALTNASPTAPENLPATAAEVTRGGAVEVADVACDEACAQMWEAEHATAPSNSSAVQRLARQLRTLRTAVGEYPPVSAYAPTTVVLSTFGAATVGYAIGTGIRRKLVKLVYPQAPNASGYTPQFKIVRVSGRYELQNQYNRNNWFPGFYAPSSVHTKCDPFGLYSVAPPPFQEELMQTPINCSYAGSWLAESDMVKEIIPPDEIHADGPVEDYTTQSYAGSVTDWPGKPTTAVQVESRVKTALDGDPNGYADAIAFF